MSDLPELIKCLWEKNEPGYAQMLSPLHEVGCPAWAVNLPYGDVAVAIPFEKEAEIAESFASVSLSTMSIRNIPSDNALVLSSPEPSSAFAALCAEFVSPGREGLARAAIEANPIAWWREWKGLLGNKSVDKRVYDVVGELLCLELLSDMGLEAVWGGSKRSSVDIDCGSQSYEVKSSLTRNSMQVQVHGLYQLAEGGSDKYLLFVRLEPAVAGVSIDGLVERLSDIGFSIAELNNTLLEMGYPRGSSARKQCYKILDIVKYKCDSAFPHISPDSFVGGCLPVGVMAINYTISLDGLHGESLMGIVDDADQVVV